MSGLKQKRCLVTGGAGFIGSSLACKLLSEQAEVIILDNLSTGFVGNLPSNTEFIEGDISDPQIWIDLAPVDYIFHMAAMVSVVESISDPLKCELINVHSMVHLIDYARRHNVSKIIFASSAAIYGDSSKLQIESQYPNPKSPYGLSKLSGEYLLNMAWLNHKIPFTALRMFNVFGPRQSVKSAYASVIPIFITRALAGEALTIFGDGLQTRDFIYIDQVVDYYLQASQTSHVGVYNAGNQTNCTINRLARLVIDIIGCHDLPILHKQSRTGDIRDSLADISRLSKDFSILDFNFVTALQETVEYYKSLRA